MTKQNWLLSSMIICIYLFLYIPLAVLILFSFNDGLFPAPWVGFSLKWYRELFSSTEVWTAFAHSLIVAVSSTALSLFFACGLIAYESCDRPLGSLRYLFLGNLFIPEVILALGLLSFFSLASIPLGFPTLIAGHTILGIGYAVPVLFNGYQDLDPRIVEASRDLGATRCQTILKVTFPLLRPSCMTAGLLVFILSFDDFIISYFCSGGEAQTLPLYIYSMIRQGISPVINALSVFLLFLSGLLVYFVGYRLLRVKIW